ncbi:MAG: hypothetical protein V1927_04045 [Candidatus Omnitrophota bacterium]
MKYLCLVGALVFGLLAGVSGAEENAGNDLKEIDTGGAETAVVEEDYGVNDDDPMAPGGIYDENTGLPDVVESDKFGELGQE